MNAVIATAGVDAAAVLSTAAVRASELLGLTKAQFSAVLGASEEAVTDVQSGSRQIAPSSKEGELATLLIRVYRSLDALVGADDRQRNAWVNSYNHALNGIPVEMLCTAMGLVTVAAYLDGMRAPL